MMYTITIRRVLGNGRLETMNKHDAVRKLRPDLTPEQREKAERIGSLEYKSHRNAERMSHGAAFHFLPSKDQH
jgi:hypothetical protein